MRRSTSSRPTRERERSRANMMLEAQEIGERLGVNFRVDVERRINGAAGVGAHRTSMLQDLEKGRPLEIDALLGALQEMGRLVETTTPYIDAVLGLVPADGEREGALSDIPARGACRARERSKPCWSRGSSWRPRDERSGAMLNTTIEPAARPETRSKPARVGYASRLRAASASARLSAGAIALHSGDMFAGARPTGERVPLDDVTLLAPSTPSKIIALWNNFHALRHQIIEPGAGGAALSDEGAILARQSRARRSRGRLPMRARWSMRASSASSSAAAAARSRRRRPVNSSSDIPASTTSPRWT